MIPDDVITQIRDAVDIVAIIGQHVQLKKAGTSWKGLCPFHGEKSPSFNVSPIRKRYHCFGCQKGGDVFGFLMEIEGKSFVEVAEQLGARYNIEIPRVEESPELRRARGERVAMLEMNKIATAFYRAQLADPVRGKLAREYLAKRGVEDPIIERFQLGYAPAEWGALTDHLLANKADLELAVRVGLIAPRTGPRGGYYDRNRDRIVCPVVLPGGDIAGFSSRVLGKPPPGPDGSEPPKYINSPESIVYKKSKLLFGLAQAREGMQQHKRVVLVEGNFDVITLHQSGFTEVVAPLGTALTIEQVNMLKRLAERIVLLYDGDRAGYKATLMGLQTCIEADASVFVAWRPGNAKSGGSGQLTDGVDPDSLVSGGGSEQLRSALDNALQGIDFFSREVWGKARDTDQKARALEDAARLIAKVAVEVRRNLFIHSLAKALEIDRGMIDAAVRRAQGRPGQDFGRGAAPTTPPSQPARPPGTGALPQTDEVDLISLLADHPDLIASPEADKAFWLLTDGRLRDMYSRSRDGQSFVELAPTMLPPPTVKLVLEGRYAMVKDPKAELARMLANLEVRKQSLELSTIGKSMKDSDRDGARLQAQLIVAQKKGDLPEVARLQNEISSNRKQVD